ncbi:unnamed protein product [Closterium sp. NIES-54]
MSRLCKDEDFQKWALDVYTLDKYGIEMRTNPTMSRSTEEGGKREIQINHLEKQVESLEREKNSIKAELEVKTEAFAQLQKAFDTMKNTAATSAAANMGESESVPQTATEEATSAPQQAQQATPSRQSVGSQLDQAFFNAVVWPWCNRETVRKAWSYWDGPSPLINGHSLRQSYKRGFAVKFCKFTPTAFSIPFTTEATSHSSTSLSCFSTASSLAFMIAAATPSMIFLLISSSFMRAPSNSFLSSVTPFTASPHCFSVLFDDSEIMAHLSAATGRAVSPSYCNLSLLRSLPALLLLPSRPNLLRSHHTLLLLPSDPTLLRSRPALLLLHSCPKIQHSRPALLLMHSCPTLLRSRSALLLLDSPIVPRRLLLVHPLPERHSMLLPVLNHDAWRPLASSFMFSTPSHSYSFRHLVHPFPKQFDYERRKHTPARARSPEHHDVALSRLQDEIVPVRQNPAHPMHDTSCRAGLTRARQGRRRLRRV